ncbi:hypothetical protein CW751_02210 [Brumimicrobium salinarum]|uniref:HTH merR-type domain-containing protein n=1 Tax=Brumimicrobium salinarum TaxID=2058658 RepID=A0A2I0R702_9FLAO|nr:MerR family transcriptional regulator [Brumimicrobium salinarum]PKR82170.1 hypothetical protein CW751_02210 [Brumimicrobium salinarum]
MAGYKIKDLETLTGIKAHTLRMWEKRYDLISPKRTKTKIRTYTDQELVKLMNVAILYDSGLKISKIASCSERELRSKVKDIYNEKQSLGAVVNLMIQSMIELDCETFERVLSKSIEKEGLEIVYQNYLVSFLKRIGVLWVVGTITPVQEHFVSNVIRQKIIVETDKLPLVEKRKFDAVLFTPEGEYHEISLLYYNYILRKRNYRTLYLGVNVPTDDLKKTLPSTNPKNLVVSMVAAVSKVDYFKYFQELTSAVKLPVFVGGAVVDQYGLPKSDFIFSIKDWVG